MNTSDPATALQNLRTSIDRELSPAPRRYYGAALLGTLTAGVALASLWLTEPEPLPLRTSMAFGGLLVLLLAWSWFFGLMLQRRTIVLGRHRLIAATIGLVASLGWVGMTLVIALSRDAVGSSLPGIVTAASFAVIAAVFRARAAAQIRRTEHRRRELETLVAAMAGN